MDILQYPIYNKLQQLGLLGLHANVVYDVIPINPMAMNDPIINATVFNVDCGVLPEAHQDPSRGYAKDMRWRIQTGRDKPKVLYINPPRK